METSRRNPSKTLPRAFWLFFLVSVLGLSTTAFMSQSERLQRRPPPERIEALRLAQPVELTGVAPSLRAARGPQEVIVRLRTPSVGRMGARGSEAIAHKVRVEDEQREFVARCLRAAPNARVLAQTQHVLNAVFMEIDAAALPEIARDPAVLHIRLVASYEMFLGETVPFIGGTAVHDLGFDGSGVRVAVLDSGIDYLHADFGGSGDPAEFESNDPTVIEPGTFPTAKVVGGTDFVGGLWPGEPDDPQPLLPDPDPLDDGPQRGHGTHVSDILGGQLGVAPGASLYALKVCSSVSSACSGMALIQAMDFAVDPNGDGDPEDRVDIINMSLGAGYGQPFDDDLSAAVDNATALGVLTVAAAGNGADKPFIVASPSAANTALSVAQTHVPSAGLNLMTVLAPADAAGDFIAIHQPWSGPLTSVIEGPAQYGDEAGGNLDGCAAFAPGSLAGKIVFVDRGACFFSDKIRNIGDAGGILGIIGLVAPGEPFAGGFGGGDPITIPGFMISQADGDILRAGDAVVRFDPANVIPLVDSMVGSSSRGPQNHGVRIKPEIGAPGASVSAEAGTGTGRTAFGGTSGASPMVAGSAALLLQARGPLSPLEVKALLMNNGEADILNSVPGDPASITRIGGGEVRVDRAVSSPAAAWDEEQLAGALSFGFEDVWKRRQVLTKTVRVRNYSSEDILYHVSPTFRFADDEANGAVSVDAPATVQVGAGRDATFVVKMTIDGGLLRNNLMSSGSQGANPEPLTTNEYDGYLVLDDGEHPIQLAWHVLPRKAARVAGATRTLDFEGGIANVPLRNTGVGTAQNDAYALLALSPNVPEGERGGQSPTPDLRAVGVNTFLVPSSFCEAEFIWAFAANTWERQTHVIPVSHQFWLDTDRDGEFDFIVLNRDVSFNNITDGRNLSWALDLSTNEASAFFFTEHATNTGNTVLFVCGEQVGLSASDILSRNVDVTVVAQDFYFGGPGDVVEGLTITPLGEQFFGVTSDVPGRARGSVQVIDFGPFPGNSPELGLLLFTNGDRGSSSRGGATQDSEAVLLTVPGGEVPTTTEFRPATDE